MEEIACPEWRKALSGDRNYVLSFRKKRLEAGDFGKR
jgi:hypothetical protein